MQQRKRILFVVGLTAMLIAAGLFLAFLVRMGLTVFCPVNKLTGLLCPGCGNTRATLALLRLDLKAMLRFNLLYPLEMMYIARVYILCARNYIQNGKFQYHLRPDWMDIVCLSAVVIWAILRNIFAI